MKDSLLRKLLMILIVAMAVIVVKIQTAVEEEKINPYVERCLERTADVFGADDHADGETNREENSTVSQNENGRRETSGEQNSADDSKGRLPNEQNPADDSKGEFPGTQEELAQEESAREEAVRTDIRVLLTGGHGYAHQKFTVSFEEDYYIQNGQEVYFGKAGTSVSETDIASLFARQKEQGLIVGIWKDGGWDMDAEWRLSMDGGAGELYQGILVIRQAENGASNSPQDTGEYYLVNALPLENYLYYVLPSEMPSDFPLEALKAQAVCARSYAMLQISQGRMEQYGADVDDTTAYQVYHMQGTSKAAIQAVDETAGQYLSYQGEPIEAFYYACSCGHSTTADIWRGSENRDYSYLVYQDYGTLEQESPWYQWSYHAKQFDIEALKSRLLRILTQNRDYISIYSGEGESKENWMEITDRSKMETVISGLSTVQDICVQERLAGDVADCLHITSGSYHIMIEGEYYIRNVLTADGYILTKQDMSVSERLTLVPSGFFEIETVKQDGNLIGYLLKGGGFGHGVGMSQYGARYLAEAGKDYEYILTYYYENVTIDTVH